MRKLLFWAACVIIFNGCASAKFGKKFGPQEVARIQPCVSVRAQMIGTFGEPSKEGMQDGYAFLVWQWADMELGAFDSTEESMRKQQKGQGSLIAYFDQRGVVVDYAYNPVGFPYPRNRCLQAK